VTKTVHGALSDQDCAWCTNWPRLRMVH